MHRKSSYILSNSISERLAKDVEDIVGFSVEGYENKISPGNIEHIRKEHGINGRSDKSMSDLHDLAKINYVIENYDNLREGKGSKEYKNSDGSHAKTVELQKKIDDRFYYVVEAVPDAKSKSLHVISAYINKNDTFAEVAVSNDPSRYVQDELQTDVSSNNIISKNQKNTTENQKKSLSDNAIAPEPAGNWNVKGKDVALEELGPIAEEFAPAQQEEVGFADEYDRWDKTNPTKVFKVAVTSDALKSIGIADKDITLDSSKLIKIRSKHKGMTDDVIKKILDVISDPMLILESKTAPSRIVMLGELVDDDGKTVLAVLELNPTNRKGIALDEIKIASAYGKDNLQNFVDTSKILYVNPDNTKTSSWATSTGLQLPVESLTTSSTDSIPQTSENATKKFSRKEYHGGIIDYMKQKFQEHGFDFDSVLSNAKNKGTFSSVDNTPQSLTILQKWSIIKQYKNTTHSIKNGWHLIIFAAQSVFHHKSLTDVL